MLFLTHMDVVFEKVRSENKITRRVWEPMYRGSISYQRHTHNILTRCALHVDTLSTNYSCFESYSSIYVGWKSSPEKKIYIYISAPSAPMYVLEGDLFGDRVKLR